jgi:hypothetical protein
MCIHTMSTYATYLVSYLVLAQLILEIKNYVSVLHYVYIRDMPRI